MLWVVSSEKSTRDLKADYVVTNPPYFIKYWDRDTVTCVPWARWRKN